MKTIAKLLIPLGLAALAGCVVVPVGRPHYTVGARIGYVAPAPVVVVRGDRY